MIFDHTYVFEAIPLCFLLVESWLGRLHLSVWFELTFVYIKLRHADIWFSLYHLSKRSAFSKACSRCLYCRPSDYSRWHETERIHLIQSCRRPVRICWPLLHLTVHPQMPERCLWDVSWAWMSCILSLWDWKLCYSSNSLLIHAVPYLVTEETSKLRTTVTKG